MTSAVLYCVYSKTLDSFTIHELLFGKTQLSRCNGQKHLDCCINKSRKIALCAEWGFPITLWCSVKTEKENAERNNCEIDCFVSDLLSSVKIKDGRKYDIVTANIVADIIIRMSPDIGGYIKDGGLLVVSGIIDERETEVRLALENSGFECVRFLHDKGWCAILCRRK